MDQQQSSRLSQLNANSPFYNKTEEEENLHFSNPFAKRQKETSDPEFIEKKETSVLKELSEPIFKESDYLAPSKIHDNNLFPDSSTLEDTASTRNDYIIEKSLKTAVIFESDKALTQWKKKMSDPHYVIEAMKDPSSTNISCYYRYPDVSLPSNQKKNIHKVLSNISKKHAMNSDENLTWYRMFSEKWRQALLSVFDTFKHGFVDYFYFIQENLTILFERSLKDSSVKARMQLTSLALAEDLRFNGIFLIWGVFYYINIFFRNRVQFYK